ncbi:T9SS type A sorting domain-containing protein [Chryseobacterium koreense]|uniref:T9SS type A sorting domain-containing protein n=1 Tax=Chryseobacterium koreense TaxID=232216 RepID=UPI0026ECE54A|nr:T9SS type A sorting domain-containing protein [Chryseobacterium koreense]
MKRILSFTMCVLMVISAYSQVLWNTNGFESYSTGNVGTQQGWARFGGGSASWTQIGTIDAGHGKSFKLASTASNSSGAWHYHDTNWSSRTSGNNIFVMEFDYYTGAATSGFGGVQIYDINSGEILVMEIGRDPDAGYIYVADEMGGEILVANASPNTWYHIKAAYDYNEGTITVKVNNNEPVEYSGSLGWNPEEFDVLLDGVTTCGFDNIVVSATNTNPFMAVSNVAAKAKVSVYPNPATDVINIKSDNKIASVSIFDASGRIVKTTTLTAINIEDFAKGSYIVNIKYVDGTTESTKVIKK